MAASNVDRFLALESSQTYIVDKPVNFFEIFSFKEYLNEIPKRCWGSHLGLLFLLLLVVVVSVVDPITRGPRHLKNTP